MPKGYRKSKGAIDPAHRIAFLDELRELALSAATDFEIAQHFGVTVLTVQLWRKRDEDVREAMLASKDIADSRVEATLFQKATGYSYHSEEIKVIDGAVVRVPTITHVPPSDTAMIFWLKNRQRDRWRDQQDVKVDSVVNVNVDVRDLAIKMLATIAAGLAAPTIEHQDNEAQAVGTDVEFTGE